MEIETESEPEPEPETEMVQEMGNNPVEGRTKADKK